MTPPNGLTDVSRHHIVLVPGFGGFDALGQVEYYSGVTTLFRKWARNDVPAVLHYFDNLPTAAVTTRARRLCAYLAKRIARREIHGRDEVVLVGHSTGGLDIRQLVHDLHECPDDFVYTDGDERVPRREIQEYLHGVVFLSVPHWGTRIADWVHSHPIWRTAIVAELQAGVAGSQIYAVDTAEAELTARLARFTDSDFLRSVRDALTEANANYGAPGPSRTADAHEAASELALFFRHMASDFHVINDLTSERHDNKTRSPAHFTDDQRKEELARWPDHIPALSFATLGGCPFRFRPNTSAPVWDLACPWTYPEFDKDDKVSPNTDLAYRICYRACAGGRFDGPACLRNDYTMLAGERPDRIEMWDNDGIVNTRSMFWPYGELVVVNGDHLDIVGHFELLKVPDERGNAVKYDPPRRYRSYDALKSFPQFTAKDFDAVWTRIFDFAVNTRNRKYSSAGAH